MPDIQAAIRYAAQGGKVGIVGYCWGGLLTWRAACTLSGLTAAAPFYGGGMTTAAEAARTPKVPVMAHFAEQENLQLAQDVNEDGDQGDVVVLVDGDTDGDGVFDSSDICVERTDPEQLDSDEDGLGNVCDPTPFCAAASCTPWTASCPTRTCSASPPAKQPTATAATGLTS